MPNGYYPQVKPLNIGEVVRTGSAMQGRNILNRLNEMKLKDYGRKMAKEQGMNELAKQYMTPARPEQVMPQGQVGPPQPATQASFDQQGYGNALMAQYPQEGMKMQKSAEEMRQAEIKTIIDLAKVSPQAAEQRWNTSPLAKESGPIKFMETKGDYSTFKDGRGGIFRFNKTTGEITPYREPRKGKTIEEEKFGLEREKFEYEKKKGPKRTEAQKSNNAEIDTARDSLKRMNLSKDEILKRTQKYTDTGRTNKAYDPYLESVIKKAVNRKVGDDLKFNSIYNKYIGGEEDMGGAVQPPTGGSYTPEAIQAEIKRRGLIAR